MSGSDSPSDQKKWMWQYVIVPIIIVMISAIWAPIIVDYAKVIIHKDETEPNYQMTYEDQIRVNSLVNQINALNSLYYNTSSYDSINRTKICAQLEILVEEEANIMEKYNPNYYPRYTACTPHPSAPPKFPFTFSIVITIILLMILFYIIRKKH